MFTLEGFVRANLTTVRDWMGAVVASGGTGEITIVARENDRPFNAWVLGVKRKVVSFELLDIDGFEKRLDAPELALIAARHRAG